MVGHTLNPNPHFWVIFSKIGEKDKKMNLRRMNPYDLKNELFLFLYLAYYAVSGVIKYRRLKCIRDEDQDNKYFSSKEKTDLIFTKKSFLNEVQIFFSFTCFPFWRGGW